MNYLCDNIIMSEDYADFVIEDKFINQFSLNIAEPYCIERGELFASLYTPLIYANPLNILYTIFYYSQTLSHYGYNGDKCRRLRFPD